MLTPIQEAEKLISSGNTEKALQVLVKGTSGRFKRKFALLLNRLKGIEKRFHQGTLSEDNYQTEKNKVSANLLFALQQYEAHLNGESVGTSADTIKWAIVGVVVFIVGFLGVRYWLQETPKVQEERTGVECPEYIIQIAKAGSLETTPDDDDIWFSKRLKTKVESKKITEFKIYGLTEDYNITNRKDIEDLFKRDSCRMKGVFVNANYAPKKKICEVYIDLIDLELSFPELNDEDRIILDNPPSVRFEINSDADLIANFVLAITSLYEGAVITAIKLFSQIEEKVNLEDQPELKAFVKLSKGNAYILNGDKDKALESYGQIGKEVKYKTATKQNIEIAKISHLIKLADGVVKDKGGGIYPYKKMKDGRNWTIRNLGIETPNSWCYDNDPANCQKYDRLYTWEAAKEACAELGAGWHLPTDEEWRNLGNVYGGYYDLGSDKTIGSPEAAYQALFKDGSSDFAALLGGWRNSGGSCSYLGTGGNYWTSAENGSNDAWYYGFLDGKVWRSNYNRTDGHSVRCLQGS